MFFTLLPVSALAEGGGSTGVSHVATRSLNTDNKDDQGLTYTLHADHTATVASYDDSAPDGVIDIPDTVISGGQPYTVTAIGVYAFNPSRTTTKVSSVFIPATVTSIGRFAFRCCKFLATVTFAEGAQLKSIGVSEKTIQRDLDTLRNHFADSEPRREILYNSTKGGYLLDDTLSRFLTSSEILAVCKILLESRSMVKEEMFPI